MKQKSQLDNMSLEEKQTASPKRRWFQFRLRTLLVLVCLASGVFRWVGWELDQRRREKVAIAWVEEMGGKVSFDFKDSSGVEKSWLERTKDIWLGKSVVSVSSQSMVVNSDLLPLSALKNLTILYLRTSASDLSPLADLKRLKYLDLYETKVTRERIDELKLALPTCLILTDLATDPATDPHAIRTIGPTTPRYPIMPTVPPDYFHE